MRRLSPALPILAVTLALAGCGRSADDAGNLAAIDAELSGANASDPALTAALHDQIMVDPQLAQSANANAVRPPPRPDRQAVPVDAGTGTGAVGDALTLGAVAGKAPGVSSCAETIRYSAAWSTRLPAAFPLPDEAAVAEAAGTDAGGCALRVVSFRIAGTPASALDWYATRARAAGYSVALSGDTRVEGARGTASYVVFAQPHAGGGSEIDLVVNGS